MSFGAVDPPMGGEETLASGPKSKGKKRFGACNLCKKAKVKCDGELPCTACRREKNKAQTCEYEKKCRDEDDTLTERFPKRGTRQIMPNTKSTLVTGNRVQGQSMHRTISLCTLIEEFAHVKQLNKKGSRIYEPLHECWSSLHRSVMSTPLNDPSLNVKTEEKSVNELEAEAMMIQWTRGYKKLLALVKVGHMRAAYEGIFVLLAKIENWENYATSTFSSAEAPDQELLAKISSLCLQVMELDCMICFSFGFLPRNTQYMQRKVESCDVRDPTTRSEMYIFSRLRTMLEINVSSEAGVWDFLHNSYVDKDQEADLLQQIAMCTTDRDSTDMQALKLLSNLMYMAMYCRKASASLYYSAPGREVPPADGGASEIIHTMQLQRPVVKTDNLKLVKKHAGIALHAFNRLCEVDADATSKSWFRLHGALVAGIVIATFYMGKRMGKEKRSDLQEACRHVDMLKQRFHELKARNQTNPLFQRAEIIIGLCKIDVPESDLAAVQLPSQIKQESDSMSEASSPESAIADSNTQPGTFTNSLSRKRGIDEVTDIDGTSISPNKKRMRMGVGSGMVRTTRPPSRHATLSYEYTFAPHETHTATSQHQTQNKSNYYVMVPSSAESSFAESSLVRQPQYVHSINDHYPSRAPWAPFSNDWAHHTGLAQRYEHDRHDRNMWDNSGNTFDVSVEDRTSMYYHFSNALSPKLRTTIPHHQTPLHTPDGGLRAVESQCTYFSNPPDAALAHNAALSEAAVRGMPESSSETPYFSTHFQHEIIPASATPQVRPSQPPSLMRRQSAPISQLHHGTVHQGVQLPVSPYTHTEEQRRPFIYTTEYGINFKHEDGAQVYHQFPPYGRATPLL